MANNKLETYVKELGEMLKKRNWKLVEGFIKQNMEIVGWEFYMRYKNSNKIVQKLTYCKMVENRTDMDEETKRYALQLRNEVYGIRSN